jgi:predicted SprT family Zn-dependent metalloprotease
MRRKRPRNAEGTIGYDLFDPDIIALSKAASAEALLPDEKELYRLFDEFNRTFFDGELPPVKISYSVKMLMAGSYTPMKKEIKIGTRYHRLFPEELTDTLKHEMIHIVNPSHNRLFKVEAKRIGASLKAQSHPSLSGQVRFIYACPACEREYPRRKRLRMASCGVCSSGGRYDSRYKLYLKKSLAGMKKGQKGNE